MEIERPKPPTPERRRYVSWKLIVGLTVWFMLVYGVQGPFAAVTTWAGAVVVVILMGFALFVFLRWCFRLPG